MGINPREQWIGKFLSRTRTEEARKNFRDVLAHLSAPELEHEYNAAVLNQETFAANCRSGVLSEEVRLDFCAYVARFPGIPGEVALEDATVRQLAVAVCAATAGPTLQAPTAQNPAALPTHLPLTEGMEVYVDGKAGGVVVTPDKEINALTAKVLVQRRGMAPEEVEVKRCTIIQLGNYPHPAVYKAQDDVQIARMRLSQKGVEPSKLKNLNLPKVPFLPVLWDGEEKVSWFSDLVKFRHRY